MGLELKSVTPQELWYLRNKDNPEFKKLRGIARKKRKEENPEKALMQGIRERAKKKSLEVDITFEDIRIPDLCPILKVPLRMYTQYAPSVDRIDPSKGYIKGNVWVISKKANCMKQNATLDELEKFAQWVLKR